MGEREKNENEKLYLESLNSNDLNQTSLACVTLTLYKVS